MVQAYNFLASWQLFPEKSEFEYQLVPKSGNYKIESVQNAHALSFSHNWVNIENEACSIPDHLRKKVDCNFYNRIEVTRLCNNECLKVHN